MKPMRARFAILAVVAVMVLPRAEVAAQTGAAQAGSLQTGAAATPRPAQTLVADALRMARSEHKVVLVHFGASWCGWCKQFDALLSAPVVGRLMSDNYVIVSLTALETPPHKAAENPGAADLMKAMNGTDGLPFFFFLDSTGKKVADSNVEPDGTNIGHPSTPAEIDAFDALLRRTAPRMTAQQRQQIRAYLTKAAASSG